MSEALNDSLVGGTTRRGLLKRIALIGAAASAWSLLARNPFAAAQRSRSVPPELPGSGSIFQPRNDQRRQR